MLSVRFDIQVTIEKYRLYVVITINHHVIITHNKEIRLELSFVIE